MSLTGIKSCGNNRCLDTEVILSERGRRLGTRSSFVQVIVAPNHVEYVFGLTGVPDQTPGFELNGYHTECETVTHSDLRSSVRRNGSFADWLQSGLELAYRFHRPPRQLLPLIDCST